MQKTIIGLLVSVPLWAAIFGTSCAQPAAQQQGPPGDQLPLTPPATTEGTIADTTVTLSSTFVIAGLAGQQTATLIANVPAGVDASGLVWRILDVDGNRLLDTTRFGGFTTNALGTGTVSASATGQVAFYTAPGAAQLTGNLVILVQLSNIDTNGEEEIARSTISVQLAGFNVVLAADQATLGLGLTTNLTATPSGGVAPYTYSWSPTAGSINGQTSGATVVTGPSTTPSVVTYTAPGAPGSFRVSVSVTDSSSPPQQLTRETNLNVVGAPTILNVTSTAANGSFGVGQTIDIDVVFATAVTVIGTPQLQLETGATDEVAPFISGSGTTTLRFRYTVAIGDGSAHLNYTSTSALTLGGGSIKDSAGNDAALTLPALASTNSLAGNKNIVIDTGAAVVTQTTSITPNGTYGVGQAIIIQVVFSKLVFVTGTPRLQLETGATDEQADFLAGSGTDTLQFRYFVQAGDSSADLDYTSTGALTLNGGTIKDAATNDTILTLAAPGAVGSLGANQSIVIDGIAPTVTNVTSSTTNGSYNAGDPISIQVVFSEAVTVTGTPRLQLETGTIDEQADFTSGSGTTSLAFTYTVQAGDTSADLDYLSTTALTLNGGTIRDAAGNDATLTLASPGTAGSLGANKAIVIDTTAPTVSNVTSSTTNGTYKIGDAISIQVVFTEAVTVTGTPRLQLETGTTDEQVNFASGTGTTTLTFTYTVQAGDASADLDCVSTGALTLNGGTIRDAAGNDATLTLASPGTPGSLGANKALVIDGVAPAVTNVTSSTTNGTYKIGDVISIQVVFDDTVTVTGTPRLQLETGATDEQVNLASGTGTNTLTFTYTVQAGDTSADLDYVSTGALTLNGGTIKDSNGNNATLTLPAPGGVGSLGANRALVVDGVVPTVNNVTSSTTNGTYKIGDVISIQVVFTEAVTVTGTPRLQLETGTTDEQVNFASGSGTATLTFTYTVQAGDTSADLDYVSTGALTLNGGTIKDAAGNDATLTLPAPGGVGSLGANKALVVDGVVPTVNNVTSSTTNGTYKIGDVISIQVVFTEAVTVTGTPRLQLETGTTDEQVNFASGSGTATLTFTYTVQAGDTSADLDYVATNSLTLNGGTIKDAAGNDATLTLPAPGGVGSLGANKALVIDGVAPAVTNVTSSTIDGTYKIGDVISIQVVFDDTVTVTGTPRLQLETGTTDEQVNFASGSGTATLTFTYTVQAGDTSADLDYVSTGALTLNGGTIKDAAGNNANLALATPGTGGSLGANKALVVDGVAPTVNNVTSSTIDGTYKIGDVISIQVVFTEAVTVTGTPQLQLETGATDEQVNFSGGSGTATLTFTYTIQAGDTSADLDYVSTGALTLNGGTIKDAAGNNANLTLATPGTAGSLGANKALVVDGVAPTVTINQAGGQVDPTPSGAASILFTVTFSEAPVGFATGDVDLSGSTAAGPLVATVTPTGDPLVFDVTVTGMSGAGDVIATIGAGVCTDVAGNPNDASTSTDNSVTWTP